MNKEEFKNILFYCALVLTFVLCFILLKPFIMIFAWSIVLAIISYPTYKWLNKKIQSKPACSIFTIILTVVILIIPATLGLSYTIAELIDFSHQLGVFITDFEFKEYFNSIDSPMIDTINQNAQKYVAFFHIDLKTFASGLVEKISTILLQNSLSIAKSAITVFIKFLVVLLTLYFLLIECPNILSTIEEFIPLDSKATKKIINKVHDTIHSIVYANLIVAIVQGALGGIAFWVLGLPSPLLWGFVIATFSAIPLIGHPVIWIPAAIYLFLTGHYIKATILITWGALVLGLIDNYIRSVFLSAKAEIHPLIVFFSVLGGVMFLGFIGILLGPVIVVFLFSLLEVLKLKLGKQTT